MIISQSWRRRLLGLHLGLTTWIHCWCDGNDEGRLLNTTLFLRTNMVRLSPATFRRRYVLVPNTKKVIYYVCRSETLRRRSPPRMWLICRYSDRGVPKENFKEKVVPRMKWSFHLCRLLRRVGAAIGASRLLPSSIDTVNGYIGNDSRVVSSSSSSLLHRCGTMGQLLAFCSLSRRNPFPLR